jgi:protein-tyrosine-phosphatase
MTSPTVNIYVCSGNIMRSISAEAVTTHTLRTERKDAVQHFTVTSAGTNALKVVTNNETNERVIEILHAALGFDVVSTEVETEARKYATLHGNHERIAQLGEADRYRLRFLHSVIRPLFSRMNLSYRDEALRRHGINPSALVSKKTFNPENTYGLVIAMEDIVERRILKRYGAKPGEETEVVVLEADIEKGRIIETGQKKVVVPPVTTYQELVGENPVTEHLSGGLEGALRYVEYFMDTRHAAIDRMLEEVA